MQHPRVAQAEAINATTNNNQQQRKQQPRRSTTQAGPSSSSSRQAPTRSQRQVSDVEFSSFRPADDDRQGAKANQTKCRPPTRKPVRSAGAKSLDQGQGGEGAPREPPPPPPQAKQHDQRQQHQQHISGANRSVAPPPPLPVRAPPPPATQLESASLSDALDDSVLVETADDGELVTDNNSPGGGGPGRLPSDLTVGLTKNLVWAVLASAVGSSFQHGYNGGVVNAPQRLIGEFVNATYAKRHGGQGATETRIDFIFALIVSIFCIGGCFGALLTAFVADRIGRKEGLMYNNILVLVAAPMMASSKAMSSYELLILGRFLIGINAGLNAGLAPLYLNEIAPVRLRGALGTIYQLVITISILLSNVFGLASLLGDEASWPILFAIPIVPAAFMLAALPHCCESPKHLILNQGRELQAQQALAWLRQTGDVQEEMDELRNEREMNAVNQRSVSLGDMLGERSLRKPLTIAIVIMLSQQLSGINAVLFYSTAIFTDAGLQAQAAVRATLGMGVVNVVMTLVSLFLVDRAGRRTLHMTGLMGMAASCLVLALCLSGDSADRAPLTSGLAVVTVYVFIAMFAVGPGAIPWFLVAELFPSNARPLASSIAVAVNWLANFTVSLCFLPVSNVLHGFTFVLFAILLVIFYLFTYYKVPETKGATAEEISALFKR